MQALQMYVQHKRFRASGKVHSVYWITNICLQVDAGCRDSYETYVTLLSDSDIEDEDDIDFQRAVAASLEIDTNEQVNEYAFLKLFLLKFEPGNSIIH